MQRRTNLVVLRALASAVFALALWGMSVGAPLHVRAQQTGGSFGGSHFGGGGSSPGETSFGGGEHTSGGGSRDEWSSGSDGGSGYAETGGSSAAARTQLVLISMALLLAFGLAFAASEIRAAYGLGRPPHYHSRISIAIDWEHRAPLQKQLEEMAKVSSFEDEIQTRETLRRASEYLRGARAGWLYAFVETAKVPQRKSEGTFRASTAEQRARYRIETSRATAEGTRERPAPDVVAHRTEGPGLVVVSMLTVTTKPWVINPDVRDRNLLDGAVHERGNTPFDELVAFELVWSPSKESDRLSSAELELLYPELVAVEGNERARRMSCEQCGSTFPKELGSCPTCGAPPGTLS